MSIDEECFGGVHPPRLIMGASRKCKDLCIDEIPICDGIPDGFLHCKGRKECRWLLCRGHRLYICHRLGCAPSSGHRRFEQVNAAEVWRGVAELGSTGLHRFRKSIEWISTIAALHVANSLLKLFAGTTHFCHEDGRDGFARRYQYISTYPCGRVYAGNNLQQGNTPILFSR